LALRTRGAQLVSADHTLEEVGRQFDMERERIRHIEPKAIRKLKHASRSDKLRTYAEALQVGRGWRAGGHGCDCFAASNFDC
jgi:hypothetical protein